jgi:hypothetical protein
MYDNSGYAEQRKGSENAKQHYIPFHLLELLCIHVDFSYASNIPEGKKE